MEAKSESIGLTFEHYIETNENSDEELPKGFGDPVCINLRSCCSFITGGISQGDKSITLPRDRKAITKLIVGLEEFLKHDQGMFPEIPF